MKSFKYIYACIIALFIMSCNNNVMIDSVLTFDNNPVTVTSKSGEVAITVRSNDKWSVVSSPDDWYSFNITEGSEDGNVKVLYTENTTDNLRKSQIVFKTLSNGKEYMLDFVQFDKEPEIIINNGVSDIRLPFIESANAAVPLVSNVPIEKISYELHDEQGMEVTWISNISLSQSYIEFSHAANTETEERKAMIVLLYEDEYGREAKDSVNLVQSVNKYAGSREITYEEAKSYSGEITDNVMVRGVIVCDGRSSNFMSDTHTLVLQNEMGKSLFFEMSSVEDNSFTQFDYVTLALNGCVVDIRKDENILDDSKTIEYKVITGLTASHVLGKEKKEYTIPKIAIQDIDDSMLYSYVELNDVELTLPNGCLTNWGEYYLNLGGDYTDKFKAFPHFIKDKEGNVMPLLTGASCSYRRNGIPVSSGSGSIRGIVVKENIVNFGIDSERYSIRHLDESDIMLDKPSFSVVLFEMGDNILSDKFEEYTNNQSAPIKRGEGRLWHTDAVGFDKTASIKNKKIAPIASYTGLTIESKGQVENSALNFGGWIPDESAWMISDISTLSVPKSAYATLQFAVNSNNNGPVDFEVQYSVDNGNSWESLGTYKSFGQLHAEYNRPDFVYAHVPYVFVLPSETLGIADLDIRLLFVGNTNARGDIVTSESPAGTSRLSQLSIKYN